MDETIMYFEVYFVIEPRLLCKEK